MDGHKWQFLASSASETEHAKVLAVCERCGLIRDQDVVGSEPRIDLAGDCPEAPDRAAWGGSGQPRA